MTEVLTPPVLSVPPPGGERDLFGVEGLKRRVAEMDSVALPLDGRVLRNALTAHEQRWLYEELRRMAQGSELLAAAERAADPNASRLPAPLAYWTHPYSRASSVGQPLRLLRWADELLRLAAPGAGGVRIDSMLAQVYFEGAGLRPHVDQDLSWGVGVSLGAGAFFRCHGDESATVLLNSGDVVVAEFGLLRHSVLVMGSSTAPAWWDEVPNLGRARCNVIFRQALSEAHQVALSEQRAIELYGRPLAEVLRESGLQLAECSLVLRHAMEIPRDKLPPTTELAAMVR